MVFSIIENKEKIDKIILRPLEANDKNKLCQWMNDPYVIEHSFIVPGPSSLPSDFYTINYASRYFDLLLNDPLRLTYAIMYNNTHIGNIGLKDINTERYFAECFIEIGEPNLRGRGIGRSALRQLIAIGAKTVALKIIELDVLEFNVAAIRLYERLGFVPIPSAAWHYDAFGMYWNVLRMRLNL